MKQSFFPSFQLEGESIQKDEVVGLPPFPFVA